MQFVFNPLSGNFDVLADEKKIPEYFVLDPVCPAPGAVWVRRTEPLCHTLLQLGLTMTESVYELRYKTKSGAIVGTVLT